MHFRRSSAAAILAAFSGAASAQAAAVGAPALDCSIGPAKRVFGTGEWLVYACSDKKSVAIVANQGNPAQPFYFFFSPDGERYRLVGEGTGSKAATQAAYDQLSKFEPAEIEKLIEQAQSSASPPTGKK